MANEKKNYYLIKPWGDGSRDGYLLLTQEEANIIQKAMDFNNWVHLEDDDGPFGIKFDANSPMTETEMEADYADRYSWRKKDEDDEVDLSHEWPEIEVDWDDENTYASYYEPRADWARESEDSEYYWFKEYGLL